MKYPYLKSLNFRLITFCILLLSVVFIINSCRKDNKNTSQAALPLAVSQAKIWYESTYPLNSGTSGKLTTQSTTNTTYDLSQLIKPDWQHPASYMRLGKSVIEMPVDPSINFGSDFKNKTTNKIYSNKKYNKTSFLLLNDGKSYQAYIMMIMADSAYVKNDLSKLANNTYRKHDADFTGLVLYFTPKGRYIGGYAYSNGSLITPPSSSQSSSGQTVQSVNPGASKLTTNELEECITWTEDYYLDGVYWYSEDLGTTCQSIGGGSGSSGGSAPGGGTPPSPPPPTCPSSSGGSSDDAVSHLTVNVAEPPPGGSGDGGMPPPSDPCTVTVNGKPDTPKTVIDSLMKTPNSLTQQQKDSLQLVLNQIIQNCIGQALVNNLIANNHTFGFLVTPTSSYPAFYNVSTGNITIKSLANLTPAALQEELFHAYQNYNYPGGTTQYAGTTGDANIEFEAKVLNDISLEINLVNGAGPGGTLTLADPNYSTWLSNVTNDFTQYPNSFTSAQLSQYFSFMTEFIQSTGYSSDIENPNLNPIAMFSLINSSPCSNQ